MAVLDQIRQMRNQGISEQEISTRLQEQGITPKAITDAFSQASIKDAVEGESAMANPQFEVPAPQTATPELYSPATQETPPITPSYPQEDYAPSQEYYPQEDYSEGGIGTDTIIEVAEQVFEEKVKKIARQLDDLREFSVLAGTKLSSFEERIKRIEAIIDNLQIKILEKVGSYGQGLESIKKEMSMMQDSFTKMIPGLAKKQTTPILKKKKISKKK